MSDAAAAAVAADVARFRTQLAASGFVDDGAVIRGPVDWTDSNDVVHRALVDVWVTETFPFAPPRVKLVDADGPLAVTFHVEAGGYMCLWDTSEPVVGAPWIDPGHLVGRIAGWLANTSAGWPDDDDCDLERYVPAHAPGMVLYDPTAIRDITGCVKTASDDYNVTTILAQEVSVPQLAPQRRKGKRAVPVPTALRRLAYIMDIGVARAPIIAWADIAAILGDSEREVRRLVQQRHVDLLLIWYSRGPRDGVLALAVEPGRRGEPPSIKAKEAADASTDGRLLRAGPQAERLSTRRVAIVGCGAVGSYIADFLFRNGIRHLTLIDPQLLRPGNLIRHAASGYFVGWPKVIAIRAKLDQLGLSVDGVDPRRERIATPQQAFTALREHDLVVDATGDERATALLRWASAASGTTVVTVCTQREGGLVRADRFPLRDGEQHLPPVPTAIDANAPVRERGCGDVVSPTRPTSVVAAAELAASVISDELAEIRLMPPSLLRVLTPQPDAPYRDVALLTSADQKHGDA